MGCGDWGEGEGDIELLILKILILEKIERLKNSIYN